MRSSGGNTEAAASRCAQPSPPRSVIERLLRFGVTGALATLVHFLTLILLVEIGRVSPVWSTAFGSAAGALVNYVLNRRYTFNSRKPHLDAGPKFLTIAVGTGLLNAMLVYIGTDLLGLHYLLVQCVATLIVFLANFLLNSVWTFREERAT
jgi:putative flippase GtrA